jgi:hypothetical protein
VKHKKSGNNMRIGSAAVSAFILGLTGSGASGMPSLPSYDMGIPHFQPVASWRYDDNCAWRDGRWTVDMGIGRVVLCRPTRPGREWTWRNDGRRQGWYDRRRNAWHGGNER